MTAPLLALDALCGSQACRGHRCPRIRHGYVRGELRGKCSQHRHCRAFEPDELADLDSPEESDATTTPAGTDQAADGCAVAAETADSPADPATPDVSGCAFCRAFTVGSPQTEHLVCECEEWCGDARCSHHPDHGAARRGYLARRAATTDSPAGADGVPGVAHRPGTNLPGTSPAPDFGGREEAAPPAAGPAAEALDLPRVSAAGLIVYGVTYLCPELHARCRCQPVRWRVHLERITDGE